jgi:hypothetical protein
VVNVDCPLVAVLRNDAGHHLGERVAALGATLLKVGAVGGDHGSGLLQMLYAPYSSVPAGRSPEEQVTQKLPPIAAHSAIVRLEHL